MSTQDQPDNDSKGPLDEYIRETVRDELSVTDGDGTRWSLDQLLSLGLTRRQALVALGAIGAGMASGPAIRRALSSAVQPVEASHGGGAVGEAGDTVDVFANEVSIAQVGGVLDWANSGSAQTVSNNTVTTVEWTATALEDTDVVTVDQANNQITVDQAGTYIVSAYVEWNDDAQWSADDFMQIRIHVNGSVEKRLTDRHGASGGGGQGLGPITAVLDLSANDTITIRVEHEAGGDVTLIQNGSAASTVSQFSVVRSG